LFNFSFILFNFKIVQNLCHPNLFFMHYHVSATSTSLQFLFSLIATRKGHSPPRFIGNASAVPFASPCMPLDCNLQRPRPLASPSYPSSLPPPAFPLVLRCLPRITVSCPSRIRICPRIRHVWGPDRIYRALNAAYRKSISESHSQQQLLYTSLSRLSCSLSLPLSPSLSLTVSSFSRSITSEFSPIPRPLLSYFY